jgi:glyceraldehyde 3-phosphate dehydrogenase
MVTRIAINGLGRIGRSVLRSLFENEAKYKGLELVAVNGPADAKSHKYLLQYDSVHGKFIKKVEVKGESELIIGGKKVKLFHEREIENLPWKKLKIDVVLECTGQFRKLVDAKKHLKAGAKKVMISAPAKGDGINTYVLGVNDKKLKKGEKIISIGSCTTNCLAPVAKVLNDTIGIKNGHMTTIHSYTGNQRVLDGSHKDLRRGRACAVSIIPTSTGAAKALGLVIPELDGKLDGVSVRVPTPNVSLIDLNFCAKKKTTVEEINKLMIKMVKGELKGILDVTNEELVSVDFMSNTHSAIFDLSQTKVIGGNFVRIAAWYDNEYGFSNRMLDMVKIWG